MGIMTLYREQLKAMASALDQEGLSQTAIAKELGVTKMTIHRWLNVNSYGLTSNKMIQLSPAAQNVTSVQTASRYLVVCQSVEKFCPPDSITFPLIIADPPWQYSNRQADYFTTQDDHYITMTIEQIRGLPMKDLALENAVLFLWATSPILEDALTVMNDWGFAYKASFVWDKVKHNMGHYNSVRHEFLLVGVRGSCLPDTPKLFDSVQSIERTSHSEKPEFFRQMINTLYPYGPKLELFGLKKVPGWEVYGTQISTYLPR